MEYEAKLDESKLTEDEGLLSIDVRGEVRPALANVKGAIMRRTQELRQVLLLPCMDPGRACWKRWKRGSISLGVMATSSESVDRLFRYGVIRERVSVKRFVREAEFRNSIFG